ncbi:type II toxin-antitoxin system RelE family toxin [Streptomyces mayteni]
MSYKVSYSSDAQRGIGTLTPQQRKAVMDAERTLAHRPREVGEVYEGSGPQALRRLVLPAARVSIGYRVHDHTVQVVVVWLIGHP